MAGLRQKKRGTGNGLKGAWENESHGGGVLLASNEALIHLGSGEGVGVEKRPVNTQKHHVFPPLSFPSLYPSFPFPLSPALQHSHILQIKWQVEEEKEWRKLKGQLWLGAVVVHWVKPTTKALISVSPSLMCARQNPFVSHLFP